MQAGVADNSTPHQLHLSLFTPHEISAWEHEDRRKRERRDQRTAKQPKSYWVVADKATLNLFDAIDLSLLDAPLVDYGGDNELDCTSDPLREEVTCAPDSSEEGETQGWSDAAIYQLHEATLHHSLKALQARGNGAEKREVLKWIFAPQTMVVALKQGDTEVEAALPQSITPFSFELCCRICGYRPEHVMDGLMPILKEMGVGNLFNEIANGSNNDNERTAAPEADPVQHPGRVQPAGGAGASPHHGPRSWSAERAGDRPALRV